MPFLQQRKYSSQISISVCIDRSLSPTRNSYSVLQKAAQQKPQTSKENMNRIRRLLREMQQSIENPHPAVSVFPSDENIGYIVTIEKFLLVHFNDI